MLATKEERYYQKLKDKLLKINILSSSLLQNAQYLKQSDEKLYLKQITLLQDYLLTKMKEGDYVAYALYRTAHEDELKHINELNDTDKIREFLHTHTDLVNRSNNSFFDSKVIYYAEVLGAQDHLEEHNDHT